MTSGLKYMARALVLIGAGNLAAAEAAEPDPARITADCRMEGEAEGLSGKDLEKFVAECAITLLEQLDFANGQQGTAGQ